MRKAEPTYSQDDLDLLRKIATHDGAYSLRGGERKRGLRLSSSRFGAVLTVKVIVRSKGHDLHATLTDAGRWMLQRIDRRGAA